MYSCINVYCRQSLQHLCVCFAAEKKSTWQTRNRHVILHTDEWTGNNPRVWSKRKKSLPSLDYPCFSSVLCPCSGCLCTAKFRRSLMTWEAEARSDDVTGSVINYALWLRRKQNMGRPLCIMNINIISCIRGFGFIAIYIYALRLTIKIKC